MNIEIYPLTIIKDRYGGTYSGGRYLAFNLEFNQIDEDVSASDVACAYFWEYYTGMVGRGNTPDLAFEDLVRQMNMNCNDQALAYGGLE